MTTAYIFIIIVSIGFILGIAKRIELHSKHIKHVKSGKKAWNTRVKRVSMQQKSKRVIPVTLNGIKSYIGGL